MKVCIYGAGAVGGHIAGRLAAAGEDVSLVVRGTNLAAIRTHGLQVETPEGLLHSKPQASDDPAALGIQDLVIVTVKAPALSQVAAGIAPLLGPETPVVFVMNGIPWWYFHASGGEFEDRRLPAIDPGDQVWRQVDPRRAVGAVAHTACSVTAPGCINVQNSRNRLVLGRPDGRTDACLDALVAALQAGGLQAEVTNRIRDAVWEKVLMNLVGGSLGILSASTMGDALVTPAVLAAAERMAQEGAAVAQALGCTVGDPSAGLARLKVSRHRQSILQDLMAGRAMEVDALLAAPLALARLAGVPTPTCDLIVGLAMQRARAARLYADPAH